MSISLDVSWKSLNKHGEELCGETVGILKNEDSDIFILSDGMGSGVKANILSTLTTKILGTMLRDGANIQDCVETIAKTWPIPLLLFSRSLKTDMPMWSSMIIRVAC